MRRCLCRFSGYLLRRSSFQSVKKPPQELKCVPHDVAHPLLLLIGAGKLGHYLQRPAAMLTVRLFMHPPEACLLVR